MIRDGFVMVTSSHSGQGGQCVQVGHSPARPGVVALGDSKDPKGPLVVVPTAAATAMMRYVPTVSTPWGTQG